MSTSPLRPYNAINGHELQQIILKELERQMRADFRFRQNCTYPVISFRWKLAVNAYPGEPANWEVNAGPTIVRAPATADKDAPPLPTDDSPVIEIDLHGGNDVTAPAGGQTADAARRDAGLGVPAPRVVAGPNKDRMVVDAPPAVGEKPILSPDTSPRQVDNVEKGKRVFGKSVTMRTKAEPSGVAPVEQPAGSAPEAEDIQKILSREEADADKE